MRAERLINALPGLVAHSSPGYAAHNWVQVVTVGAPIPAQQATVFQVSQDGDQRVFTATGLAFAHEQGDEGMVGGRHTEGSEGIQNLLCSVTHPTKGKF